MARPRTLEAGVQVRIKIPAALVDEVDAVALADHASAQHPEGNRSAAIRRLLEAGLLARESDRLLEALPPGVDAGGHLLRAMEALWRRAGQREVLRYELTRTGPTGVAVVAVVRTAEAQQALGEATAKRLAREGA